MQSKRVAIEIWRAYHLHGKTGSFGWKIIRCPQGPRSKFLSGVAKDERVSQIGVGGGNA